MHTATELEVELHGLMSSYATPLTYRKLSLRSMDNTVLRQCSVQEMEVYLVDEKKYPDFYEHIHTRSDRYLGNMMYHVFKSIEQLHENNIVHGTMSLAVVNHLPKLHAFQFSRSSGIECLSKSIEWRIAQMDKVTLPTLKSIIHELKSYVSKEFLEKALVYYSQFLHQSKEERINEAVRHWKTWDIYTLALKLCNEKHRIPYLETMLHYDPKQRPTIKQCLQWYRESFNGDGTGVTCETGGTASPDETYDDLP